MSQQCLIAEFGDRSSLATAVEVLQKAQYAAEDYSVVTSASQVDDTLADDAVDNQVASPPAKDTVGASTVVGGTLGAVLGTATMIGPLLVAGPLAGMAAGAIGGSVLSSINSWGVKHDVGESYEQRVAKGSCLIVVSGDEDKLDEAERMLQTCGPKSLSRFTTND